MGNNFEKPLNSIVTAFLAISASLQQYGLPEYSNNAQSLSLALPVFSGGHVGSFSTGIVKKIKELSNLTGK